MSIGTTIRFFKRVAICVIVFEILVVLALLVYHHKPLGVVKNFALENEEQKEKLKMDLQKHVDFELPPELELVAVATQHGKDKLVMIQGIFHGDLKTFPPVGVNHFGMEKCQPGAFDIFPDEWNLTPNKEHAAYQLKDHSGLEIRIIPDEKQEKHILCFVFSDNHFLIEQYRTPLP